MKLGPAALVLVSIAIVLAVGVLWFFPAPKPTSFVESADSPQPPASSPSGELSTVEEPLTRVDVPPKTLPAGPEGMAWEDRLDELLTVDTDNATTVRALVGAMGGLPPEAQEEFVAHAANLCEDDQFNLLAGIYLDQSTPFEVVEIIFNDALNRPDEISLPLLASTLRNPAHPMAGEAKEILEMYLDLEPGNVPLNGWDQAVKSYLAEETSQ